MTIKRESKMYSPVIANKLQDFSQILQPTLQHVDSIVRIDAPLVTIFRHTAPATSHDGNSRLTLAYYRLESGVGIATVTHQPSNSTDLLYRQEHCSAIGIALLQFNSVLPLPLMSVVFTTLHLVIRSYNEASCGMASRKHPDPPRQVPFTSRAAPRTQLDLKLGAVEKEILCNEVLPLRQHIY